MSQQCKTTSFTNSTGSWKSSDGVPDQFPVDLRVLVVDDDSTCLLVLETMLRNSLYQATKSNQAEVALQLLREKKDGFDIVISDVHMPDMDGFKLLEHIGFEMDLPVIMMSADDTKKVVMKGVTYGACDYLIKPVRRRLCKTYGSMWFEKRSMNGMKKILNNREVREKRSMNGRKKILNNREVRNMGSSCKNLWKTSTIRHLLMKGIGKIPREGRMMKMK